MALSGMITFGLFVVLIGCLNGQPTHPIPFLIRASGRTARIQCRMDSSKLTSNALHWYRLKDQAFQRLMYFEAGSKTGKSDPGVPSRYAGSVKADLVTLTISTLESSDAGSYYCALWSEDKKVFGSGTRLYVTDQGKDKIIAPKLSGYLPSAKGPDKHDKQTMLCQASGMFPDLVRFEWKKNGATWNDVSEGDVVEQRNTSPEITVTSILIVDKDKAKNNNYQCSVTHEGSNTGPQILDMKKEDSTQTGESTQNDPVKGTCAPTEDPIKKETSGDSEQISSMSLFVYAYGVMLMKNALFFCVVSVFLLQRRAGKKDEIS